jgi:hypothetical protein
MAPPFRDNSRGQGDRYGLGAHPCLRYRDGLDQELLARNEYLAAENRILKRARP